MGQPRQIPGTDRSLRSRVMERSPFVRAIRGESTSSAANSVTKVLTERQDWERLARFSARHAEGLRGFKAADTDVRRDRQSLEWCAQFSTRNEATLRKLLMEEAGAHQGPRPAEQFTKALRETWDASKHPRGGYPENRGWWSPAGGASGGSASGTGLRSIDKSHFEPTPFNGSDSKAESSHRNHGGELFAGSPSHGGGDQGAERAYNPKEDAYLPSGKRGKWHGDKGDGVYRLKKPVRGPNGLVKEIEFRNGFPVMEPHKFPGASPTILITGTIKVDKANAIAEWKRLNPNLEFPRKAIFHHDLLQVTTTVAEVGGQKKTVIMGTMHLIPAKVHSAVAHQGSASVGRRFYKASKVNMKKLKQLSRNKEVVSKIVGKVAGMIEIGKIPDELHPHLGRGRKILSVFPLVGSAIRVVTFASDVEAHGWIGAGARATPFLGDVIGAYDLGTELAAEITARANAKAGAHLAKINSRVDAAWEEATIQTIEAFKELASQIKVTNPYGLVDANDVVEALTAFQTGMGAINQLKIEKAKNLDYDARAAEIKIKLRQQLIKASQKNAPQPAHRPLT